MTVDLERGYKRREPCGPKQYLNLLLRSVFMIFVGIDVAKDKHDCFITNSDGEVLFQVFTILVLCQEIVQIKHALFRPLSC